MTKVTDTTHKTLESLVQTAKYFADDSLAFVDDDSLYTTTTLLVGILKVSPGSISPLKLGHFVNYLHGKIDAAKVGCPCRAHSFLKLSNLLTHVPIWLPQFPLSAKQNKLEIELMNLHIKPVGKEFTIKGSLSQGGKAVIEDIKFKLDNITHTSALDLAKVKPGYYQLKTEASNTKG